MGTSAATAVAVLAATQARQARKDACAGMVHGYEHDRATVSEAQSYASCIRLLHPDEYSPAQVFAIKAAILLALIGFFGGAVYGWLAERDWGVVFLGAFFGCIAGPFAILLLWMGVLGVRYLFTA